MKASLQELATRWPSAVVSRSEIGRFSGGLVHSRTIANCDCLGVGPVARFRVGRKIAYKVSDVITWLEKRSTIIEARRQEPE